MKGLRRAVALGVVLTAATAAAAQQRPQRHQVTQEEREAARNALDAFTSPTLTRFRDEAEFRRYLAAVRAEQRTRGDYYYSSAAVPPGRQLLAQAASPAASQPTTQHDVPGQECVPTPGHPCTTGEEGGEMVVVTGSRIAPPRNPSITNNQMRNVEEGDIIKQIDHYLLILQDGRIFVIDMEAGGSPRRPGRELRLTDRMNVYRYVSPSRWNETWYDEMLVSGDRILVTGYSYESRASELAVFRLDRRNGRLRREGVFRISSNDYYSSTGYATRLIGDNLVIYTPFLITDMENDDVVWPLVRPWRAEDDARERAWLERRGNVWNAPREAMPDNGPPLLRGGDIYRPVERIEEPVVHSVSVCPLAGAGRGVLACRSTAVVAPMVREYYVTADHTYLWTDNEGGYCSDRETRPQPTIADARRALVYRVPLTGAGPELIGARGTPPDQFAMQADERNLYALVRLERVDCRTGYDGPTQLAFVTIPQTRFGPTRTDLTEGAFAALPGTPTYSVAARFTERYLVYGGLSNYRRGLPDPNEFVRYGYDDYERQYLARRLVGMRASPAVVVPVVRPDRARTLATGHTVIRADRLGDDIILTGYRDRDGLSVTLIDLDAAPRIASSVQLPGRYESEGRSHAFNARLDPDGSSLMGLPTVPRIEDSDRDYWRTSASDLSFLTADRHGRLRPAGELLRRFDYVDTDYGGLGTTDDEDGVPGYQCEVSCTDWYGNSRPVFTDGRIFGLSGTELIEGRMVAGQIRELRRLNIALSPPPAR
ncbi:MAG TPA: beta-propeller domain-containing protein [Allosphingosinicella sp.]|nr:beta-propeller domain-containing protein [Allosphingosinicella sp.]